MSDVGPGGGYDRGYARADVANQAASGPGDSGGGAGREPFSGSLSWTRARTPRYLALVGKAFYGAGSLGVLGSLVGDEFGWYSLFTMLGSLAWPLFVVSFVLSLTTTTSAGHLTVSAAALGLVDARGRRRLIARNEITSALVVQRPVLTSHVTGVEIGLASGDVLTARFPDPRAANALVEVLGFGRGGRRNRTTVARPLRRLMHPALAVFAWFGALAVLAGAGGVVEKLAGVDTPWYQALPVVTLGLYTLLVRLKRAPEITVGDDGVRIVTGRRSQFVPGAAIAGVTTEGGTSFVLVKHDGSSVRVRGLALDADRLNALAHVVEERHGLGAAAPERLAQYDRGTRDVAAWRAHLARNLSDVGYRESPATIAEADGILRSPVASPEQRVGAALALRIAGEPRERIRVAVDAAADDATREALAAAERDDDVALEKALRRLSTRG